jgi:hypothetical protein
VALGLSEPAAVGLLWALAALGGALAVLSRGLAPKVSVALTAVFVLSLTVLGVRLARVRVDDRDGVAGARPPDQAREPERTLRASTLPP